MDEHLREIEAESRDIRPLPLINDQYWERVNRLYDDYLLIEEMKQHDIENNN